MFCNCNLNVPNKGGKINYCQINKVFLLKHLRGMKKSLPLHRFKKAIDCFTKKLKDTMKKLVFMFVAFAAISFASCGNKTSDAAATNDSDSVVTVDSTDTVSGDSAVVADSSAVADSTANA